MHTVEGRVLNEREYSEYCRIEAARTLRQEMPLPLADVFPVGTLESEISPPPADEPGSGE